jgi:polyribonucleotide nucleotidyltransferase
MTEGVTPGKIYEGRVTSIKDFGAFVEIIPGKDGLCHISELSDGYVGSVTDVCKVGDPMLVKVILVDDQDRVKLSRKQALAERGLPDPVAENAPPRPPAGERPPGGPPRRDDRGDRGPRDRDRDRDRGPRGGGPRDR